jgi:quercetin 2,3-dioxygenase
MRFIQMWFSPSRRDLKPSVQQKAVEQAERSGWVLPLVSNSDEDALPIVSDARVCSSYLPRGMSVLYEIRADRGIYLYVLEGGRCSERTHPPGPCRSHHR